MVTVMAKGDETLNYRVAMRRKEREQYRLRRQNQKDLRSQLSNRLPTIHHSTWYIGRAPYMLVNQSV